MLCNRKLCCDASLLRSLTHCARGTHRCTSPVLQDAAQYALGNLMAVVLGDERVAVAQREQLVLRLLSELQRTNTLGQCQGAWAAGAGRCNGGEGVCAGKYLGGGRV